MLVIVWFVQAFFRRVRHSVVPLLCALMLLFHTDCALTMGDLEYSAPKAEVVYICDKPLDVPPVFNSLPFNSLDLVAISQTTGGLGAEPKTQSFGQSPKDCESFWRAPIENKNLA